MGGELRGGILCGSPPTWEGSCAAAFSAVLPAPVGELRGGILCGSPRPCRGGVGGGVSIVISHVCFRLFEKFAAKIARKWQNR